MLQGAKRSAVQGVVLYKNAQAVSFRRSFFLV